MPATTRSRVSRLAAALLLSAVTRARAGRDDDTALRARASSRTSLPAKTAQGPQTSRAYSGTALLRAPPLRLSATGFGARTGPPRGLASLDDTFRYGFGLTRAGDRLFFVADDEHGEELWTIGRHQERDDARPRHPRGPLELIAFRPDESQRRSLLHGSGWGPWLSSSGGRTERGRGRGSCGT